MSQLNQNFEMNIMDNFDAIKNALNINSEKSYDKPMYQETSFIEQPPPPISTESETVSNPFSSISAADEVVGDIGESVASEGAGLEFGAIGAAIGGVKATGEMASSSISNMLSTQFSNIAIQNQNAHGVDAERQSAMVNEANQQSLGNAHSGMDIGSWFGPLGSYLGYAFSNTNTSSSLNFNTGYSSDGMVNPELYNSVSTSYASTESDTNQSVIAT